MFDPDGQYDLEHYLGQIIDEESPFEPDPSPADEPLVTGGTATPVVSPILRPKHLPDVPEPSPAEMPFAPEHLPDGPHAPVRCFAPRRAAEGRFPEEGIWGCGILTFVKQGAGRPHGGWQGSCKWHAKNQHTQCKKVVLEFARAALCSLNQFQ